MSHPATFVGDSWEEGGLHSQRVGLIDMDNKNNTRSKLLRVLFCLKSD